MDVEATLSKVRGGGELPEDWVVFPLLQAKLIQGIINWMGGALIGGFLLVFVIPIVIPSNYMHGFMPGLMTTLMLAMFAFICIGSIYLLIVDILRWRDIKNHVIVITDQDYIKQEGDKIIQVPLSAVLHVTARGQAPAPVELQPASNESGFGQLPGTRERLLGPFLGRSPTGSASTRRKRSRTPTSLAFRDERTGKEVTVVNDGMYGDPFLIAAFLKERAMQVQSEVTNK